MLRSMMMVGLLCTAVATTGVATGPVTNQGDWQKVRNSPLGRLISGNVGRLLVLRSELNITPEQRQKIRAVIMEHRTEIAATVKEVRAKRVALRNAVLSGKADEAAIRTAAHELGEAVADAAVKAAHLRNDLAPILTSEQRAKIKEFLEQRDNAIDSFLEKASQK